MIEHNCPNCNSKVNRLYPQCNHCGINLSSFILIIDRITALESAAALFLEEKKYLNAHRAFSVLLEYKPDNKTYMIGYAQSAIALGNIEIAGEIAGLLSQRFRNNKEVDNLKELIERSKT